MVSDGYSEVYPPSLGYLPISVGYLKGIMPSLGYTTPALLDKSDWIYPHRGGILDKHWTIPGQQNVKNIPRLSIPGEVS
jgi:hypothetical protein